jgi:hypothetical protein
VECSYHLPYLCDCRSLETTTSETEKLVPEELLMPDPVVTPPADDEELTPAEEKKFGKYLNKFLEEDDTPTPTPTHTPTPAHSAPSGSVDLEGAITRALDAREGRQKDDKWRHGVEGILENLTTPKKRRWFDPFTMFSDK